MTSTGKNIIRKQTLQFLYNGKANGLDLQNEVSEWCNDILIPEMEQMLDGISNNDIYLSIDKLEIEAIADKSNWQEKLRNELLLKLKEELAGWRKSSEKPVVPETTPSGRADELILFYFKNGFLPWWSETLIGGDFKSLLLEWVKEDKNEVRKKSIAEGLKKIMSKDVRKRIINFLPVDYFLFFLKDFYKWNEKFIASLEKFLLSVKGISKENEKKILTLAFQLVAANEKGRFVNDDRLFHFFREEVEKQTGTVMNTLKSKEQKGKRLPKGKNDWEKLMTERKQEVKKEQMQKALRIMPITFTGSGKQEFKSEQMQKEISEGIYIENAGVVIFAPFLPALIGKLKLLDGDAISDPQTAVLIIQYAASGATNNEEFHFVFPKVLCGLDIEYVIDAEMELTDVQKQEVNEMLSSVITHWAALKNTSVAGLQGSFLMRAGKLSVVEDGWYLQVEKKSFDILLDYLPWNIGVIKLPWMREILRTEWA